MAHEAFVIMCHSFFIVYSDFLLNIERDGYGLA